VEVCGQLDVAKCGGKQGRAFDIGLLDILHSIRVTLHRRCGQEAYCVCGEEEEEEEEWKEEQSRYEDEVRPSW